MINIMIIEIIRKRIKKAGESLNEISRNTGVDVAVLSRIMHGGDCKTLTADRLLSYFGLTVMPKRKRKRKAR
jgi:transcriptional regulator with XRE-family HTH domain